MMNNNNGFTLVEILVVLAILTLFTVVGLFLSTDVYRSSLFRADADTVVSALQRARSRSINNINESRHGVRIDASGYTIFQGSDFSGRDASKDEFISIGSGFSFTPATPIDIIFEQLSGESNFNGGVVISNDDKTTTVNINSEGRIDF